MRIAGTIFVALLLLAMGLSLMWGVFAALKRGVARAAGGRKYARDTQALLYWVAVLVQVFFAFWCIYGVVRCFERLSR